MNDCFAVVCDFIQIGAVSVAILMLAFARFFFHALLTNYGAMYSAYDAPLNEQLRSLCAPLKKFVGDPMRITDDF